MLNSAMTSGLATLASTLAVSAALVGAPAPSPSGPPSPPGPSAGTRWVWPVQPPRVLRGFDDVGRYEAGHRGVDLATTAGAPVVAVAAGSVTFAGPVAGRPVVVVLHPDGLRTTYEPVDPAVTAGADVQPGQQLGTVSTPAHCAADCLHLGLRDGDVYLDPLPHLRAAAPVLLPLGRP